MAEKKKIVIEVDVDSGDSLKGIDKLEASMSKTQENAAEMRESMEEGFDAAGKGAKNASKGFKGLGGSLKGVITSLGLIGAAMAVFNFLKDILMKNQAVMDALNTATLAFEIVIKSLFEKVASLAEPMKAAFSDPKQAVIDLYEAVKTNLINRLEGWINQFKALGKVIKGAVEMDWDTVKEGAQDFGTALIQMGTGLDAEQQKAFAEGVKEFAKEAAEATKAAVDEAAAITKLENELKILEARQRKQILVSQNLAELERQKRDDISLTIAERIEANERLGDILDEQIEIEEGIAQKRLNLAMRQAALDKNNIDLQVEVINAETELADVRERINGQRSEQLTNQKALEKELFDFQQELRLVGKSEREIELEELMIEMDRLAEIKRLAGDTEIDIEAETNRRLAELEAEWNEEDLAAAQKHADDLKKIEDEKAAAVQKAEEDKQKYREAGLSAASSIVGSLGQLAALMAREGAESIALQKTLAIAQVAIDTASSISSAIAGATASATATGAGAVVTTPVFIATQVATVLGALAQVGTILASVPGPSATIPGPSSVSAPSSPAPAFDPVTTNTTELGGAQQAQLAPIQAFVIETEMTGNQNNISQIENQVTFGIDG